jgi:2-oxoacid:acceptor oxidoreductase gamma subunit (pyruvate/2-ketoisovalerate family)
MGPSVVEGLKPETKVVVNTDQSPKAIRAVMGVPEGKIYVLDATSLAIKILGRPITNTAMLGAVVKVTGMVEIDSMLQVVGERFGGRIGELNKELIKTTYEEVVED